MQQVKPKKRLGQHFLKDRNIAQKIVHSIQFSNLPVVEVGPGTGVLTTFLMDEKKSFVCVDVDDESVAYLKLTYPDFNQCFKQADFLKEGIGSYFQGDVVVLGNFPYNISSQLFFKILEQRNQVKEVVCMVQKEVASRICTGPGSKEYGILSVFLQAFFNAKYLFTVSEGVFFPPPKVKSGVMRLERNNREKLDCDEALFFRVVKKAFNQRRKTLRNSLKEFNLSNFDPELMGKRPEQLSVEEFVIIVQNVK